MARLAAYYQEDFHYPAVGYGPKQRKSAYLVYEEPKNNLYRSNLINGDRIRNLATSEPALCPNIVNSPEVDIMTLKERPLFYGSQLIESPHSSIQHFENVNNTPSPSNRFPRYGSGAFDNESISSYGDMPPYDNRYNHISRSHRRERTRKRLSYAEPGGSYVPSEMHQSFVSHKSSRHLPEEDGCNYSNRFLHPRGYYIEPSEPNLSPPLVYRPESRQGKWHWATPNTSYLSPPSPLDSGLSSQSITSSPSLEAEPVMFRSEDFPTKPERHPGCLCPKVAYPELGNHPHHLSRYVSGRTTPGAYSVSHQSHAMPGIRNSRIPNGGKAMSYAESEFDSSSSYLPNQVRYGKLGIVGESTNTEQNRASKTRLDNFHQQGSEVAYVYTDENGIPVRKPHSRQSHKSTQKYTKPCVIIIESPEKCSGSDDASSPERDHSDKSQGPGSPMSVTASNSTSESPSVSSSNNDLDIDDQRKSNKTTEREIRELEDMYKKCNLNDRDLLDRAERRDLPTPHQEKINHSGHRLMRSNSDTLYEVMSPVFRNPYETPRRAPPLRRSGMPDRIADDMALRKLRKPVTNSSFNPADNTITYMLCSSHFTPTVPAGRDILFLDNPDIELDDLSYRKHYFRKKGKIMDPQPPFGIPLRPPPPQKIFNDYLHVVPSNAPQPLCHPRGNPDVVRDDMAFRTLRKEEPERIYYDISQVYRTRKD